MDTPKFVAARLYFDFDGPNYCKNDIRAQVVALWIACALGFEGLSFA